MTDKLATVLTPPGQYQSLEKSIWFYLEDIPIYIKDRSIDWIETKNVGTIGFSKRLHEWEAIRVERALASLKGRGVEVIVSDIEDQPDQPDVSDVSDAPSPIPTEDRLHKYGGGVEVKVGQSQLIGPKRDQ